MSRLELAERVIELRERADLTQGEAAKRAGVGVTTWSNIETGAITRPHARTLIKIARALGVEPEELTSPKERRPSPRQLLEEAGVETRWFAMSHEEWLESFRSQDTAEAAQKLVDIAVQMEDEFGKLMALIHTGAPNSLGYPTLAREYLELWRQAIQRRLRTYSALEELEEDQEAPEHLRQRAGMILQSMRKASDEEYARLLPSPKGQAIGRSYV